MKELREQFEKETGKEYNFKDFLHANQDLHLVKYIEWLEQKYESLQAKLFRVTTSNEFVEQKLSEKQQTQQTWYYEAMEYGYERGIEAAIEAVENAV